MYTLIFFPVVEGIPSTEEFSVCLRKIKYAFHLLVSVINHRFTPQYDHSFIGELCCDVFM